MSEVLEHAEMLLNAHWHHAALRPAQAAVIEAIFTGNDVLALLPVGAGKSATYQIPAMMCVGVTVVISPLIALMKDQCDDANMRGIDATYINSHVTPREAEARLRGCAKGQYKLLYIAPERLKSKSFVAAIAKMNVSLIAVDESHCSSRWGHDFRPAYMRIHNIYPMLADAENGRPPVLAVTATATPEIEVDICKALRLHEGYARIAADPVRPNLKFEVNKTRNHEEVLVSACTQHDPENGRMLVYVPTQKLAEETAILVNDVLKQSHGDNPAYERWALPYHAGMTKKQRETAQTLFKSGTITAVTATCAFGMGIDVPDIRSVIQYGIPPSVEDYLQAAGRGGRDGKPCRCLLIHTDYAFDLCLMFLNWDNPPYAAFERVWKRLHEVCKPNEIIHMTVSDFVQGVSDPTKPHKEMSTPMFASCLATMESMSIIDRPHAEGAVDFELDEWSLSDNYKKLKSGVQKRILAAILSLSKGRTRFSADRKTLAKATRINETAVMQCLTKIRAKKLIKCEVAYVGKATILPTRSYGQSLDHLLSHDVVEMKRKRAEARLNAMVEYTKATDFPAYLRKYFVEGLNIKIIK